MIYHLTPWLSGDIGGGLNAAIECLPADAWVCLRDGDTMFLTPQWGKQVEQIVAAHGDEFDLIGCMTNRIRAPYQLHDERLSDEPDVGVHVEIAKRRWNQYGSLVQTLPDGPVAGFLMLFRRATWARHPFQRGSIYFDQKFTTDVRCFGGKVGLALGLYVFHLYRWGARVPAASVAHLSEVG